MNSTPASAADPKSAESPTPQPSVERQVSEYAKPKDPQPDEYVSQQNANNTADVQVRAPVFKPVDYDPEPEGSSKAGGK
jgi:hypothetical protein